VEASDEVTDPVSGESYILGNYCTPQLCTTSSCSPWLYCDGPGTGNCIKDICEENSHCKTLICSDGECASCDDTLGSGFECLEGYTCKSSGICSKDGLGKGLIIFIGVMSLLMLFSIAFVYKTRKSVEQKDI
jgi:hypothetical protein